MNKDYKIGMLLGLVLVIITLLRSLTAPNPRLEAALLQSDGPAPIVEDKNDEQEPHYVTDLQNIDSLDNSTATVEPKLTKKTQPPRQPVTHIVGRGETLSAISEKYYGNIKGMQKIIKANKIKNPDKLSPGTLLIIPD
ncbi:MAG: LysM peptidoglycan-binding domain-containing protein [Planctomycetota bacterium]|jgi:nucleoid-associated protein YgaU